MAIIFITPLQIVLKSYIILYLHDIAYVSINVNARHIQTVRASMMLIDS